MTIVGIVRACAPIVALALCVGLVACSAEATTDPSEATKPAATSSASPDASPTVGTAPTPNEGSTDPDQPVVKVERAGQSEAPSVTADPADTDEPVEYGDDVSVRIDDVSFAAETSQGPGSFPGRDYARLTLSIENGSSDPIDLGTSVLTVLDASGAAAVRVYAAEADTVDFAGALAPGDTATASYAFAIPADARDEVTVVVDFDGEHTSAVFRGGLD